MGWWLRAFLSRSEPGDELDGLPSGLRKFWGVCFMRACGLGYPAESVSVRRSIAAISVAAMAWLSSMGLVAGANVQPSGLAGIPGVPETGNDYATVRIISECQTLQPNRINWIALDFGIAPQWHLYWKFAGDTGIPPAWRWEVPEGVTVGSPVWPVPKTYSSTPGSLDYIFETRLILMFPVSITAEAAKAAADAGTPTRLVAHVDWLVCKTVCLPGQATVSIELPASPAGEGGADVSSHGPLFASVRTRVPLRDQGLEDWGVSAAWLPRGNGRGPVLQLQAAGASSLTWYPDEQELGRLPFNRYRDGSVVAEAGAAAAELRVMYRPTTAQASIVRGVLEIERGGSKVWLDLQLPPPGSE